MRMLALLVLCCMHSLRWCWLLFIICVLGGLRGRIEAIARRCVTVTGERKEKDERERGRRMHRGKGTGRRVRSLESSGRVDLGFSLNHDGVWGMVLATIQSIRARRRRVHTSCVHTRRGCVWCFETLVPRIDSSKMIYCDRRQRSSRCA